MVNYTEKE